ncbi:MAG: hypothetical protein HFI33_00245 [Lachnospiraceae bacterium]|nr:hypothetical protein [Lachnospiraceae bacterium]
MRAKYFVGASLLLCYVVGMDTAYRLISYYQTGTAMTPALLPWLLWVLGIYGLDLAFFRRGGSLARYLWMHGAAWILLSILGNLYWMQAQGLAARIFAVIFYGISLVMAEETARLGVRPNQTLVQTEGMLILLGILLFLEEMQIAPDSPSRYGVLAGVIFSLLSLILTRVMREQEGKDRGGRVQGAFLLGTLFLLLALCGLGFAAAFSSRGRQVLGLLVDLVLQGGRWVLTFLGDCLDRLVALFPVGEAEMPLMEPPQGASGLEELPLEMGGLPPWGLPLLMILAVLAVGVGFVWLLRRFGQVRLLGQAGGVAGSRERLRRRSLVGQKLWAFLERWVRALLFRLRCLRQRNSLQVLLLRAEKYGRRHEMARETWESPEGYLRRLAGEEKLSRDGQGETLEEMARALEMFFYSGKAWAGSASQVKEWKRVFR